MTKTLIALAIVCGAYLASAHRQRTPKVEVILRENLSLGEGPHWDHKANALYWVDIYESTVLKYDRRTQKVTRVVVDKENKTSVSFVIPVAGSKDKFAIPLGHTLAVLTWDGVSEEPTAVQPLVDVAGPNSDLIFNDGKADPSGRLWSGTLISYDPDKPRQFVGTLYSLNDDDKSATSHLYNVGSTNGLAWSCDKKTMYYIDSYNQSVYGFDYDIKTTSISNQRVVFNVTNYGMTGSPDGMTIDIDDKLWVAIFFEGLVCQVDPADGSILQTISIPAAPTTSSCIWGGENLDELYITSSKYYDTENSTEAGYTYRVTGLGTSGRRGVEVKL